LVNVRDVGEHICLISIQNGWEVLFFLIIIVISHILISSFFLEIWIVDNQVSSQGTPKQQFSQKLLGHNKNIGDDSMESGKSTNFWGMKIKV